MAKQIRKIRKKIKPKENAIQPKKKEKSWSDYILMAFLALTAVVMIIGWDEFTNMHRGLYLFLTITLGINFARRNYELTPEQDKLAERVSYVTMAIATALFALNIYFQYMQ